MNQQVCSCQTVSTEGFTPSCLCQICAKSCLHRREPFKSVELLERS
jgi:hypothetical protein